MKRKTPPAKNKSFGTLRIGHTTTLEDIRALDDDEEEDADDEVGGNGLGATRTPPAEPA